MKLNCTYDMLSILMCEDILILHSQGIAIAK